MGARLVRVEVNYKGKWSMTSVRADCFDLRSKKTFYKLTGDRATKTYRNACKFRVNMRDSRAYPIDYTDDLRDGDELIIDQPRDISPVAL